MLRPLCFPGASITLITGKPVLYSGLRQMLIGCAAAAVTLIWDISSG